MAGDKPEADEIPVPKVKESSIPNRLLIGFRGANGVTNIVQTDDTAPPDTDPSVHIDSQGDIYLRASSLLQTISSNCKVQVVNTLTIHSKDIVEHIAGAETCLIDGDYTHTTEGNYSQTIHGNHDQKIASCQYIAASSGRTVNVGAKQHIKVDGNINETVNGKHTREVAGSLQYLLNNTFDLGVLGGFMVVKATTEQSLTLSAKLFTGLSAEASAQVGGIIKTVGGAFFEQSISAKFVFELAAMSKLAVGLSDDKTISFRQAATAAVDSTKSVLTTVGGKIKTTAIAAYNSMPPVRIQM